MSLSKKSRTNLRPPLEQRCFVSPIIEELITDVTGAIACEELAFLFSNCFPNTLDTTISLSARDDGWDTFIITGDIPAMWLRDSSAQIWPYLPLAKQDQQLQNLFIGTLNRQARSILLDPYANAFYKDTTEKSPWQTDRTTMRPGVHERKWELDSLGAFMRLSFGYWQNLGDKKVFDELWQKALTTVCQVIRVQMGDQDLSDYRFQRLSEHPTESLALGGRGNPNRSCGLVASGFRPSDDACIFPYHIPSNFFVAHGLRQMAELSQELALAKLSAECASLAQTIQAALPLFGQAEHPCFGTVYCYEVDGFGSRLIMDDANIPSLLSLPYLGCIDRVDPVYQSTRALIWSPANPYFVRGSAAVGISSPHIARDSIWPLSLIMYAMSSENDDEILSCLRSLVQTQVKHGFMRESFHKNNAAQSTRDWFAWANSLFGEWIYKLYLLRPDLLKSFRI